MKRLLIKGISAAAAAAMLCVSGFAAEIPYTITGNYSENEVTVSGTIGEDGQFVVLQVLDQYYNSAEEKYEQYTYEQLSADRTNKDMILYSSQITANKGAYSFVIEYPDDVAAGYFNARLVTDGTEEVTDFTLPIVSSTAYETAVGLLNDAADAGVVADFVDAINDNSLALGMDTSLLSGLNDENAMKPYMDYIKANHLDAGESVTNTKEYNTYVLMAALKENDIENIDPYVSGTTVFGTALYTDYKALADEVKKQTYITGKMSGKNFADMDSFVKTLKQALIFEEVYYATGYAEVKDILSKYGSTVGITATAANDVYKEMQGKDYTESTILADYNSLKEKYGSGSTGGSGGGGGGGGISGGTGRVPAMDGAYGGFTDSSKPETVNAYFHDIDGVEWATEAILALADKGIINGKSEGYFAPDDFVTREEFAKILVGAMGYSDEKHQGNVFGDVSSSDWFCSYVNIAYNKNLIKGIGNGLFGSGQQISRQDMAVMLYNALLSKAVNVPSGEMTFADGGKIANYAKAAVGALYEMGIVNGVSETEFDPLGSATRAQAAKMIYGALKQLQ